MIVFFETERVLVRRLEPEDAERLSSLSKKTPSS